MDPYGSKYMYVKIVYPVCVCLDNVYACMCTRWRARCVAVFRHSVCVVTYLAVKRCIAVQPRAARIYCQKIQRYYVRRRMLIIKCYNSRDLLTFLRALEAGNRFIGASTAVEVMARLLAQ